MWPLTAKSSFGRFSPRSDVSKSRFIQDDRWMISPFIRQSFRLSSSAVFWKPTAMVTIVTKPEKI